MGSKISTVAAEGATLSLGLNVAADIRVKRARKPPATLKKCQGGPSDPPRPGQGNPPPPQKSVHMQTKGARRCYTSGDGDAGESVRVTRGSRAGGYKHKSSHHENCRRVRWPGRLSRNEKYEEKKKSAVTLSQLGHRSYVLEGGVLDSWLG